MLMLADTLDLAQLASALHTAFPELGAIEPLYVLGSGFRSVAIETAAGQVFRIARNQTAASGYAKEWQLLPIIAPRLPVAVPAPRWRAGPSPDFPFGVIGYAKLPGIPLQPAMLTSTAAIKRLAHDIADFLLALHRLPLTTLAPLDLPGPRPNRQELTAIWAAIQPVLRAALTSTEVATLHAWWAEVLADQRLWRYTPTFHHGDCWYENILIAPATLRVVGVVDFEQVGPGDPARDLATQYHLGEHFGDEVLVAYRALAGAVDPDLPHRVRRQWELREVLGLGSALRDDPTEIADSIRKLRAGPILSLQSDS
jgi:aminoglycoside phosphotransferase (APT) family kinase protein